MSLRVYCNYIGRRQNDFNSPEDKLLHFLSKIFNENDTWKWQEQYPTNGNINLTFDSTANSKGKICNSRILIQYIHIKYLEGFYFFFFFFLPNILAQIGKIRIKTAPGW